MFLLKNIMKKEFYGIPVYKEFEGNLYRVPEKYDLYLKQLYGNYMEFPPLDKRCSLHNFYILDLFKPNKF